MTGQKLKNYLESLRHFRVTNDSVSLAFVAPSTRRSALTAAKDDKRDEKDRERERERDREREKEKEREKEREREKEKERERERVRLPIF